MGLRVDLRRGLYTRIRTIWQHKAKWGVEYRFRRLSVAAARWQANQGTEDWIVRNEMSRLTRNVWTEEKVSDTTNPITSCWLANGQGTKCIVSTLLYDSILVLVIVRPIFLFYLLREICTFLLLPASIQGGLQTNKGFKWLISNLLISFQSEDI